MFCQIMILSARAALATIVAVAEYPERSADALVCLAPDSKPPAGPHEVARHTEAEALTTDQRPGCQSRSWPGTGCLSLSSRC
jgi:hypothetical protein